MNQYFLIYELSTNGYTSYTLDIISLFAIFCSILVIKTKNPIISVLFLIALFANISLYLMFIGLSFIGLTYLIVYIGAVSILFLFILMLINIRLSELQSNTSNSILLGIISILVFSFIISQLLPYSITNLDNFKSKSVYIIDSLSKIGKSSNYNNNIDKDPVNHLDNFLDIVQALLPFNESGSSNSLFFVTSKIWDGALANNNHITSIGNIMYTNYVLWLIIASFILLLAMVGAIIITIKPEN